MNQVKSQLEKGLSGILLLMLAGCATANTRIFPKEDGSNVIVSSSVTESHALDGALDDAKNYCDKRNQKFIMIDQKSEYQGMNKDVKAGVGIAGAVLDGLSSAGHVNGYPTSAGAYSATHSMDDNKVTMTFKCQPY